MYFGLKHIKGRIVISALFIFLGWSIYNHTHAQPLPMRGISLVAPPSPFETDPMPALKEVNANWVAVIPYAFIRPGDCNVIHDVKNWQWWGERPEGIIETIKLARKNELNILLKPQIWIPGSWPGDLTFKTEEEWQKWETTYRQYIMHYVMIADSMNVPMLCIGTELKHTTRLRTDFWEKLIEDIRCIYDGDLTYAANWDNYTNIPFWQLLDYIGIDAYFPLSDDRLPDLQKLLKLWEPIRKEIDRFSDKADLPYIFTEYGYLSVDAAASRHWELEQVIHSRQINEEAQAIAIRAILQSFAKSDHWKGAFLWKWFPEMKGHEGFPERDYTPQGKLAEHVLRELYQEMGMDD